MRKYCLSYDAIDSSFWEPNELKKEIVKTLIEAGATEFENPVASTILFHDPADENRIHYWNGHISRNLNQRIYYYLSLVPRDDRNRDVDRNEGDPILMSNFNQLIADL